MRLQTAILFAGVCAFGLVAAAGAREQADEPVYEGKKLSEWLRIYRHFGLSDQEAKDAVRQLGTNCIPHLLSWIDYTNSEAWKQSRTANEVYRSSLEEPATAALDGFRILGSAAAPACGTAVRC